jgi:hypothetical protein
VELVSRGPCLGASHCIVVWCGPSQEKGRRLHPERRPSPRASGFESHSPPTELRPSQAFASFFAPSAASAPATMRMP